MSQKPNILNEISRKKGIKLLMTLKNAQNVYDEYVGSSIEDYYNFMEKNDDFIKEFKEEIENEEQELNAKNSQADKIEEKSQEMLSDVDSMLKEIQELKSKINEFKLANKIKTKRDYLKYMNLVNVQTDGNNEEKNKNDMAKSQFMFHNKIEKDFKNNNNDEMQKLSEYKKYIIPKENEKDKNYKDIMEKLQKQEEQIKQMEKENDNKKINIDINKNMNEDFREQVVDDGNGVDEPDIGTGTGTGDEDVDKLLNEIKMVDLKMDSYLKDIDECLEMNENIEKHLDNNDYEEEKK